MLTERRSFERVDFVRSILVTDVRPEQCTKGALETACFTATCIHASDRRDTAQINQHAECNFSSAKKFRWCHFDAIVLPHSGSFHESSMERIRLKVSGRSVIRINTLFVGWFSGESTDFDLKRPCPCSCSYYPAYAMALRKVLDSFELSKTGGLVERLSSHIRSMPGLEHCVCGFGLRV